MPDRKQEIIVIETFSEDDCFYTDPINEVAFEKETDALEYALKHAHKWAKENNKDFEQTDLDYYSKKEVIETVKEMISDGSDFGQCGLVIRRIPLFRKE